MKSGKSVKIIICVIAGILLAAGITTVILFRHYAGLVNYDASETERESAANASAVPASTAQTARPSPQPLDEEALLRKKLEESQTELPFEDGKVLNILLIGTDNRSDSETGSRSDSMIVVSINTDTKMIVAASLLRDMYLSIPNSAKGRLNTAFAIDGAELLIKTIEANFSMPIDKYVLIDFYSFIDIVDILGGVEVDITQEEISDIQWVIEEINTLRGLPAENEMLYPENAGLRTLTGTQALAYARNRHFRNGDLDRSECQRKLLAGLMEKAKGMKLSQLSKLAETVLPQITTSISERELLSLLLHSADYLKYEFVPIRIPADNMFCFTEIDGASVIGVDLKKNSEYWHSTVYDN